MRKRKEVVEVEVKEEETVVEDEPEKKKEKKEYHLAKYGTNIRNKKKTFADKFFMTYDDGVRKIAELRGTGKGGQIVQKRLLRHISLPYHMASKSAMQEATNWIAQNTVGKYRKEFNGIAVAVGTVDIVSPPRVIGDQFTFHMDVAINQIVFTPKMGDKYEAKVKYSQEGLIVGVVMDMITCHVRVNKQTSDDNVFDEDVILVKYTGMKIKNSLCHLQGDYVKMVKKAEPKVEQSEEVEDEDEAEIKQEEEYAEYEETEEVAVSTEIVKDEVDSDSDSD